MADRMSGRLLLALLVILAALAACAAPVMVGKRAPTGTTVDTVPLRSYARARGRHIGTAAGTMLTMPGDSGDVLRRIAAREFDMLWSGTFMKFAYLRPNRATYDYAQADSVLAFGRRNGMVVRGHTLVWHEQLPDWITSGQFPPDTLRVLLKDHIVAVMTHFKGRLVAWDVVNEAMGNDGRLRPTIWLDELGPGYVEQAFRWAHAVDPHVPLYYNDYGAEIVNAKSDAIYALLRDLKTRGVPIHGIGFQSHFPLDRAPSADAIAENFARFAALGLKIQITEADIRVPLRGGVPSETDLQAQAKAYRELVNGCLRTPACNAIELEGIYDGQAWLGGSIGGGAPLLYDIRMRPKPAYHAVKSALAGK